MKNMIACFALFTISSSFLVAQHNHEHHKPQAENKAEVNTTDTSTAVMTHSYSLSLPMSRNSSGTAWQPDATPMYGYMKMTKRWNLMFHGSIFVRYNYQ